MENYSVKQLSKLAGVSIRTLHHYDQIGLLKPSFRTEKGYRFYKREELLLLQQILFYKELGFSLKHIDSIINDPSFELVKALESHKKSLKIQLDNTKNLIQTIDKTINELKNKKIMDDTEIYQGFSLSEIKSIKKEVSEKWGEKQLIETEERIIKMGKEGWKDVKKKGEEINRLLADLMDLDPNNINVQKAIELHYRHMNLFYKVSRKRYLGLANMYVEDERFKNNYDNYKKGLALFIKSAIEVFCKNSLTVKSR